MTSADPFMPLSRRWVLSNGLSSDDACDGGLPAFTPSVGKEEFSFADAGRGCSFLHYRGAAYQPVRNEVTINNDQPFLMIRSVLAGRGEFLFKGVGTTADTDDRVNLFFHGNPTDACVSMHNAHEEMNVAALMISADRLQSLCEGMRVPAMLDDLLTQRNRNGMSQVRMSAVKRRLFADLVTSPYTGGLERLYREGKVLEIVAALLDDLAGGKAAPPYSRERRQARIRAVCDHLLANLNAMPSQEILAREAGMPPRQLAETFRDVTGMTMPQWMVNRKMEMAARMLLDEALPVKEISHRLGYAQVSTFTTAFSRHYGFPPADFRKSRVTRHFVGIDR
ncbi:hypothetical protein CU669_15285 [Paramagnetospirillum kuznetsovii]|uniref:HTH araC/xylS-type domain-containing protein n=1 Tax=Paramagnetospirillum kuznetsovii TaxID=2053833 RepID=A0A364NW35_9PROT|nr:AraC family transcriptional regulator [Paramagnetospirillum kuznetsovii]RAU21115.1 hypothetical protein CU669_15285 [Paramagnetospirillum kuznetsovii]